ncbi:MAG: hypothetical protein L0Y55_01025, partial [Anaerolineales bacterium]|nr:hypothetical protein [Anaerolineales bacterium]
LEPDDFADAETRAFFLALREFGSAADFFDHDAFRAALDPSLTVLFERLSEAESGVPELNQPDLAREIEIAAYRLRAERDKTELARLEVLLRDQDEPRDAADEPRLHARVGFLLKRVAESQKALSARTLLKTR